MLGNAYALLVIPAHDLMSSENHIDGRGQTMGFDMIVNQWKIDENR
jgi:hypothetical protein